MATYLAIYDKKDGIGSKCETLSNDTIIYIVLYKDLDILNYNILINKYISHIMKGTVYERIKSYHSHIIGYRNDTESKLNTI